MIKNKHSTSVSSKEQLDIYLAGESSFAKAALKLNDTGFSIRASGQRNSPAISGELTAYFSLEITPVLIEYSCAVTE